MRSYINHTYNEDAVKTPQYALSSLSSYYIPESSDMQGFKDYISSLPNSDKPEIFGQHRNADIASQIRESNNILSTLLSLQPQISSGTGKTREEKVLSLVFDLQKKIPDVIDYEATYALFKLDMTPFNVVLLQEIKRYNELLYKLKKSLNDVQNGLKGIVVMTSDLEDVFASIYEGKVPPAWSTTFSSSKPLASWIRDLLQRIEYFSDWSKG